MKSFGIILIIAGCIWGAFAINLQTTVDVRMTTSSIYSYNVPEKVHNIGLMDAKRNNLIGAGIAFISGVILFGFGSLSTESTKFPTRKCPFCAEYVKVEAIICKHCNRNLPALKIYCLRLRILHLCINNLKILS